MNNLKNKILQEFLNSDIKIISQEKLEQYIEYCIVKNQGNRIKGKTSHHHILPNASFNEYKELKENPWNGSHLLYSDHYYAHWLLTEAIDDYGQLFAFCSMHSADTKLGRIDEYDLIPPEEFQKKMEEKGIKHSTFMKTICDNGLSIAQNAISKVDKNKLAETMRKVSTNKVVVKDKENNIFQVDKDDERYLCGELVGHTKGKFVAKDILGNNFLVDLNDERYIRGELVAESKGRKHSKETRNKISEKVSGINHPNAKKYKIFNEEGELKFECHSRFTDFCQKLNLPYQALIKSYRNNGSKLYQNNISLAIAKRYGFEKYKGWYAISYP